MPAEQLGPIVLASGDEVVELRAVECPLVDDPPPAAHIAALDPHRDQPSELAAVDPGRGRLVDRGGAVLDGAGLRAVHCDSSVAGSICRSGTTDAVSGGRSSS